MNPPSIWILGQGGLLGQQLARSLTTVWPEAKAFAPSVRFAWKQPERFREQFADCVREWVSLNAREDRSPVLIWSAGAGVVGSSAIDLATERIIWQTALLELSREDCRELRLFLASSAGGVYAGSDSPPFSESTPPLPLSDYGRNKLLMEGDLRDWLDANPGATGLIGRIANLYGPGQNLTKPQGLISHLATCLIHHEPIHIYVPLDTIRDYLFTEDAARVILQSMQCLAESPVRCVVKIIAAERPTTIGQLLSMLTQLTRQHPRIIAAPHSLRALQPRSLQFRSEQWPHLLDPRTDLRLGLERVYRHLLQRYQRGELPPQRRAA
jgi:UDP-glucose 4-epimerase